MKGSVLGSVRQPIGDLLIGNHSRDRRKHIYHGVRVIGIVAHQAEMFGHGFHVHLGFVFGVLRDLQIVQRDGAVVVQVLGALNWVRARTSSARAFL